MTQLNAINEILHHENYLNVTGLQETLGQYIDEQVDLAADEDAKLTNEEKEIVVERNRLDNHPCPCVLSEWSSFDECTVSCSDNENGGGTRTRKRSVLKEPVNSGLSCEEIGGLTETISCNGDKRCRKLIFCYFQALLRVYISGVTKCVTKFLTLSQ